MLTHCNSGALATMGGGTAFGAIRALARDGRLEEAIATETRPLLQGARLTVWELHQAGLPHRLCVDSAARGRDGRRAGRRGRRRRGPHRRERRHREQDRHVRAGLRRGPQPDPVRRGRPAEHRRRRHPYGADIPIEERDADEVVRLAGADTTVPGTRAYNPAFDVTPADLITAIVTEQGVWRP